MCTYSLCIGIVWTILSICLYHDFIDFAFLKQIQPCKIYGGEHKECRRLKGRFNQYFVFGAISNCQHWAQDYNNCQKYNWFENKDAAVELIRSELARREKRFKAHYANDIWEKRVDPPEDWNKPLPAFMVERNKNSYLEFKKREAAGERFIDSANENKKFCTFM